MTSVPSATTWGSPIATKHALLIHGLTSSSYTWHRVASSLAAQGYLVTAPNLIGHGLRASTDHRLTSIVDDLLPYLEAKNYSMIIGHSLGALTALALFPHLPLSHPTAFILVDPPMRASPELISVYDNMFTDACTNPKHAEIHCAENPLWKPEDGIGNSELGCQNKPWDFLDHLIVPTPNKWKVTALVADPTLCAICSAEYFHPHSHIRTVTVPGVGHCIQSDAPDVVVEEALKAVTESETA